MDEKIIITYVYHSCYTVETSEYFIIFDYFKGILNIPQDKKVIFVATHAHEDHYTSEILKVPDREKLTYILSSDIGKLPTNENIIYIRDNKLGMDSLKSLYNSDNVYFVDKDHYYSIELADSTRINIKTFGSTDQGISILLFVDGLSIFHAGDLNYWAWPDNDEAIMKAEKDEFMVEVDKIKKELIDIAFFPVDPRLDENYALGAEIFITEVKPQIFLPMHFGSNEDISLKFSKNHHYDYTNIRTIYEPQQKIIVDISEEEFIN